MGRRNSVAAALRTRSEHELASESSAELSWFALRRAIKVIQSKRAMHEVTYGSFTRALHANYQGIESS